MNKVDFLQKTLLSQTDLTIIPSRISVGKRPLKAYCSVGVFTAPTWLFRKRPMTMPPHFPDAPMPQKWKYEHSTGLKFAWRFSKHFAIETGFNYLKTSLKHNFEKRLEYNEENLQVHQNESETIHLDFDVSTDFGDVPVDLDLVRQNSNGHSGGHGGGPNESHHLHLRFQSEQNIELASRASRLQGFP